MRIEFENNGQEFLWWEINERGIVMDGGPSQSGKWLGAKVHNKTIKPGDFLDVTPITGDGLRTTLKFRVETVYIEHGHIQKKTG